MDWICIADARALTDMGLAARNPGGWSISDEGRAVLLSVPDRAPRAVTPRKRPDGKSPSQ